MYAEYESFVSALIGAWLGKLPTLFENYSDLPEDIRTQHRVGLATILQKLGGDQYSGITESAIVAALQGVNTQSPYVLLGDAFWVNTNANLRLETTRDIIRKVGAGNPSEFLAHDASLQAVLTEIDSTIDEELKLLVEARNTASHDYIDQVEGLEVHERRAKFLIAFARSLATYFELCVTHREIAIGVTQTVGEVAHVFSGSISWVNSTSDGITLKVGTTVLVVTKLDCFRVRIESIEIDKTPQETVVTKPGMKLGVKTTRPLSKASLIAIA